MYSRSKSLLTTDQVNVLCNTVSFILRPLEPAYLKLLQTIVHCFTSDIPICYNFLNFVVRFVWSAINCTVFWQVFGSIANFFKRQESVSKEILGNQRAEHYWQLWVLAVLLHFRCAHIRFRLFVLAKLFVVFPPTSLFLPVFFYSLFFVTYFDYFTDLFYEKSTGTSYHCVPLETDALCVCTHRVHFS